MFLQVNYSQKIMVSVVIACASVISRYEKQIENEKILLELDLNIWLFVISFLGRYSISNFDIWLFVFFMQYIKKVKLQNTLCLHILVIYKQFH